ncbi:hypothetical protein V6Z11_A09G040200 [Gossypium hirsutum]
MKILCWNCHGIGNPMTTKVQSNKFPSIRSKCRMEGCLAVNACGKSGGLVMMWKEGTNFEVKSYSSNHIDSLIRVENDNPIRFTGFYGNADPTKRKSSWDMLRRAGSLVKEKWIIGGDFNAILDNSEKEGGRRKPQALMDEFCEVTDELSLATAMIKERLDRFLILASDVESFPFTETKVIRQSNSDHNAIVLDTKGRKLREEQRDSRLMFRYDICWAKELEAKNIIKNAWKMDTEDIMDKLEKVGHDLGAWQFKRYKRMRRQIDALKSNINRLIDKPVEVYDGNKLKAMRIKLRKLLDREEQYWAQRSRVTWPKEWDRNTRFFHVRATSRKKKNRIEKLKDMHGNWRENTKDICEAAREYFQNLFESTLHMDETLNLDYIDTCIS